MTQTQRRRLDADDGTGRPRALVPRGEQLGTNPGQHLDDEAAACVGSTARGQGSRGAAAEDDVPDVRARSDQLLMGPDGSGGR
jgi:hypothetical protein